MQETLAQMAAALWQVALDPYAWFYTAVGVFIGIVFGALPGLTSVMGIALLLPITFSMDPVLALSMLIGVYVGGMAGGAIPAILLNIPGTPSAAATVLDGYPMAKKGEAAQALGWAVIASVFGGLVSWLALALVAPQLARFAVRFGPPEYAALALFGLTIIAGVSGGNILKGVLAGMFGLALSFVGIDPITGHLRFTFQSVHLMGGIRLLPVLIGVFAIPEIVAGLSASRPSKTPAIDLKNLFPGGTQLIAQIRTLIRSSLIGVFVGMIPAVGSNVASFLSYFQAQRASKHPERFGQGVAEGVIAAEAANNGVSGGALIPMFTLGIPGDSITAVLLGGLMIHGLQPGPNLFRETPDVLYRIFGAFFFANILMGVIQYFGIRAFIQMLRIPHHYLGPMLLILAIVGSYSLNNSWFDVWVMVVAGIFGYFLFLSGFPAAPVVLGLVLGPILESQIRRSLIISGGDWSVFVTRPLSLIVILLSLLSLFGPALSATWKKRRGAAGAHA